jgi:hypothetical protein
MSYLFSECAIWNSCVSFMWIWLSRCYSGATQGSENVGSVLCIVRPEGKVREPQLATGHNLWSHPTGSLAQQRHCSDVHVRGLNITFMCLQWWLVYGRSKGIYLIHGVQTDSGAQTLNINWISGRLKRLERETVTWPPSSALLKNVGAIPPLPHTSSWYGA